MAWYSGVVAFEGEFHWFIPLSWSAFYEGMYGFVHLKYFLMFILQTNLMNTCLNIV